MHANKLTTKQLISSAALCTICTLYFSAITFQIQVANRYKLNKKLRRLKQKSSLNPADVKLKTQIAQAEVTHKKPPFPTQTEA